MNWDYIAGFLDADGSFFMDNITRNGKQQSYYRCNFSNSEASPLYEIQNFFKEQGIKSSVISYFRDNRHKMQYALRISRQFDLLVLAQNIKDKVIIKRGVILQAIDIIQESKLHHHIREDVYLAKECLQLWESGLGTTAIARKLGVTRNKVEWYIYGNLKRSRRRGRRDK